MPTKNEQPDVVTTRQAAEQLGVAVRTVQLWVEAGRLKAWKTAGNHRRIYQSSVDQLLAGHVEDSSESPDQRPSILIVEDDRTTQVYYESMLQLLTKGLNVVVTSDGIEGLVAMGRYSPQLLILDIEMPRLDGIQVVSSLRRQALTADVAIVVVSNLDEADVRRRGLPADVPFVNKPITLDALRDVLNQHIDADHLIDAGADQS